MADPAAVAAVLDTVMDPEIPVVSIVDLGIVRDVTGERVVVTPTYSGCPATHAIEMAIRGALDAAGVKNRKQARSRYGAKKAK